MRALCFLLRFRSGVRFIDSTPCWNGLRLRGYEFNVRPSIVAFADAGRGWIVGPRNGDLTYPSGSIPLEKYRTDVGLGLDLGVAGFYVAKAVSTPKEPANFFVRIHNRF